MGVLFECQWIGPALLHGIAQTMQRPDAGIAAPRKDQLRHATGADQLIVNQIRGHADERQIAAALTDDLVTGGEWNQVSEALQSHNVTVANHFLDRLFEWKNVSQTVIMPRLDGLGLFRAVLMPDRGSGAGEGARPTSIYLVFGSVMQSF